MKKILLLCVSFLCAFAFTNDFLEPHEAFKPTVTQTNDKIIFEVELGKDIYLYNDKLKVFLTQPQKIELTSKATIPTAEFYDDFMVNFGDPTVKVEIALSEIKAVANAQDFEIEFLFQGCSKAGLCYAPMSEKFQVGGVSSTILQDVQPIQISQNETDMITSTLKNKSGAIVLLTFFGFGLLLSFTPCVFPMIPILSSIIVNAGNKTQMSAKKGFLLSLVYVLAMSVAYTIAGVIAGIFGANLQATLQNPYVLVVFALVFVALAFSMFGYFRIEPPQWLQSKVYKTTSDQKSHGIVGIAVMGFLSALIVGPCVAPPLAGALVYIGQTGDALLGGLALFAMSLGMGIPLLAIGAGAGKFMPKPGGWMSSVSKLFGVLMLAIAIWMLERIMGEITLYLWAILLIGSAIYWYEQNYKHLLVKTVIALVFIYGVVSFVGAISGANNIINPLEKLTQNNSANIIQNELSWVYVKNNQELDAAIKNSTKPIMLDFYAAWCVSCKELENITFKDVQVVEKLKEFTLIKADVTNNTEEDKALQKRFGVFGPPALIFWNEKKEEVNEAKIIGYKNAEDFLTIINKSF
ncbi:MAG: protein-disulfide reductase DsbD [Arcobacteraceae bacterium]